MWDIDSSTRLCSLIGHPIKHSVSPQMHNAAFRSLGLNYVYLAFDVKPEKLEQAVKGLEAVGAVGFNVTIPHKVEVTRFLDELDESAERTGAVNTVVIKSSLKGYNTDVYGIEETLRDIRIGGYAMIIGAGGAARAAGVALINLGFRRIIVANRTLSKAKALVERLRELGAEAEAIGLREAGSRAQRCSLIINATPIGMTPNIDETPLRSSEIPGDAAVLDLVYNPVRTRLLTEAEKAGAQAISGLEVLVYQGARAFKLWTGVEAPVEVMRSEALRALKRWRG